MQSSAATSVPAAGTPATRMLLTFGVIGAPLFVIVSLLQAFTREGFDPTRHPISMLSLGELGWIQVANFVLSGLLIFACAVGLRRVLHPGRAGTWGPLLIAVFGLSLIGGGVFLADPGLGFPPGAPEGPPPSVSTEGIVHGIAFGFGMLSLITSFFVFARRFAAAGERGWARYSIVSGVLFLVMIVAGMATQDFRILTAATVVGWGWVAAAVAHIRSWVSA